MRPLGLGEFIFKEKTFVGSQRQEGRGTGGPAEGGRRWELGRRGSFWKGGKASLSPEGGGRMREEPREGRIIQEEKRRRRNF